MATESLPEASHAGYVEMLDSPLLHDWALPVSIDYVDGATSARSRLVNLDIAHDVNYVATGLELALCSLNAFSSHHAIDECAA